MKVYKYIFAGLIMLNFIACSDYLDKETFDIITPEKVWQDPILIDGVMVNLYDGLQLNDFNYWFWSQWRLMNPTSLSDEAQGSFQKPPAFDNANASFSYMDDLFELKFSDMYKKIRNCNNMIEQLEESTVLTEETKNLLMAEGRFIRAMHYFELVKRYGGVPLITSPQVYSAGNLEELMVSRNKEAEIYDFIVDECNEIANQLPVTREAAAKYRVSRGTVLALCSRAALYAGSIAKYGTVELDGVVGIANSDASHFFQASYNASKALLDLNAYSLYDQDGDKVQNFTNIFTKSTDGENGEYIFQKQYDVSGGRGHDWDKRNAPFSYRQGGWGCGMAPVLEMVESYEYTDGSEGTLAIENEDGSKRKFDNPYELFANKDPRLFASIYLPGSPCKGTNVEWMRGIIVSDTERYMATGQPGGGNTVVIDGISYSTSGKDGGADAGDASKTGFYQKKFFDETLEDVNMGKSETPWPVFRLGEIYLNMAEACVEIGGKDNEALTAINKIRDRAGIALLSSVSLDDVRHERKVELAFEGHRFWDLKRWRLSSKDVSEGGLNGFRGSALYPWYDIQDGKYVFEIGNKPPKQTRIFLEKNYYSKINNDDMNSNPNLVQNPGYTN
ncbi:RagB/SusD family nutrient uptake outer membrane protein [Sunxiuqinia sp. A32]|uniref:RagB/SusD family nutrient uptake outer membrane protein n=1 Tax=Sunxiuqinia sp. A32 TaxID=3461496 RepID=UPI004046630C